MNAGTSSLPTNSSPAKRALPTLLLLVLAGIETYYLVYDIPLMGGARSPASDASRAPVIGELVNRRNTVLLQNPGDLVWDETRDGQTLHRRQTLMTSEASKADIAFLDGTGLILDERSMIQLEKSPSDDSLGYQRIVVTLLRGKLHKRDPREASELLRRFGGPDGTTPELEVRVGNASVTLTPASEVTVSAGPELAGGNRIEVLGGEVPVRTPTGDATVLAGEVLRLPDPESQAPPAARKAPFRLIEPKAGMSISGPPDSRSVTVKFRWEMDPVQINGSPLELELSPDPTFRTSVRRKRISATHPPLERVEAVFQVPSPPATGLPRPWHWRVRALGRNPLISESELFFVQGTALALPLHPREGARVKEKGAVDFTWSRVSGAADYELELAGKSHLSKDPYIRVEGVPAGDLGWRVRAKMKDGAATAWSELRTLRVIPASSPAASDQAPQAAPIDRGPPPPDELLDAEIEPDTAPAPEPAPAATPEPRHTQIHHRIRRWLLPEAIAEEGAAQSPRQPGFKVRLKWSPVPGIKKYRIQVARQVNFNNVLIEAQTDSPQWVWQFKPGMENTKGRVFFRVASVDDSGKVGQWSTPKPVPVGQYAAKAREAAAKTAASPVTPAIPPVSASVPLRGEGSGQPETFGATEAAPAPTPTSEPTLDASTELPSLAPEAPVQGAHLVSSPATTESLKVASEELGDAKETPSHAGKTGPESSFGWSASLHAGFGALRQSSGAQNFNSVSFNEPYLNQKFGLSFDWIRPLADKVDGDGDFATQHYTLLLELSFAGFDRIDPFPRMTPQPKLKTFAGKLDAVRWEDFTPEPWNLALGLRIDRSFRWVKNGPQTLESPGGFSLGPVAHTMRYFVDVPGLVPESAGASLAFPFTGVLTKDYWGAAASVWAEWRLAQWQRRQWIGFRAETEFSYSRWIEPKDTGVFGWVIWGALAYHFDEDEAEE